MVPFHPTATKRPLPQATSRSGCLIHTGLAQTDRLLRQRHGDASTVVAEQDDYDVSSMLSAERLLTAHLDRLLVVTDDQDALSDLYVLGDNGV